MRSVQRWLAGGVIAGAALLTPRTSSAQGGSRTGAPPAPRPAVAPTTILARVMGFVFDSTEMRPLRGAMVQLVAANDPSKVRSVNTDERGSFSIDTVQIGTYLLGFFHPRLDSLSIESPLLRLDVRADGEIRIPMAIPSGRTLVARVCGPQAARDSAGLFMGFVRSSRGEPLGGAARIRAQWSEVVVGARGIERRSPSHFANTSPAGAFAMCGVPTEGTFVVRAFAGTDSSGVVDLVAPAGGLLFRDIFVGSATKVQVPVSMDTSTRTRAATEAAQTSTSMATVLRGNGRLRGVVRGTDGRPITGARVVLWGSGLEASTNANGQFALQSLPSGTYTIESRAIGFVPRRSAVDVLEGVEGVTDVALETYVPTVDTMRIRADRVKGLDQLADFEKRRKRGFGYFMDEEYLTRRNAMYMADVFRMTPGVSISPGQSFGDQVMMRGSSGAGSCVPAIFLNGVRTVSDDGNIDQIVSPQEVRAIEVYTRTGSMPQEFSTMNGCGSIVIWTGARVPTRNR